MKSHPVENIYTNSCWAKAGVKVQVKHWSWFSSAYSVAFLKKDVNKYMHIYHRSFSPKLNTRRNAIKLKNNLFFSYVFWPFWWGYFHTDKYTCSLCLFKLKVSLQSIFSKTFKKLTLTSLRLFSVLQRSKYLVLLHPWNICKHLSFRISLLRALETKQIKPKRKRR